MNERPRDVRDRSLGVGPDSRDSAADKQILIDGNGRCDAENVDDHRQDRGRIVIDIHLRKIEMTTAGIQDRTARARRQRRLYAEDVDRICGTIAIDH